jgi:hypothetical protein
MRTMPWLRQYVACLSLRRPTFDITAAHDEFVVDKMALEHVILLLLRLSSVSTILIPSFITDALYP